MEAIAIRSHVPKSKNEHALLLGQHLCISEFPEPGFGIAEMGGRAATVSLEHIDMSSFDWFAGNFTADDAAKVLLRSNPRAIHQPLYHDGAFLVRYPTSPANLKFKLSVKLGHRVVNMKVFKRDDNHKQAYFLADGHVLFDSLNSLIKYYQYEHPLPDTDPPLMLQNIVGEGKRYQYLRIERHPVVATVADTINGRPIINEHYLHYLKIPYNAVITPIFSVDPAEDEHTKPTNGKIQLLLYQKSLTMRSAYYKFSEADRDPHFWRSENVEFDVAFRDEDTDLVIPKTVLP